MVSVPGSQDSQAGLSNEEILTTFKEMKETFAQLTQFLSNNILPLNNSSSQPRPSSTPNVSIHEIHSEHQAHSYPHKEYHAPTEDISNHSKQVREIIKDLRLKEEFDPANEAEFDHIIDHWSKQVTAQGHSLELLKFVIIRVASERVAEAIASSGHSSAPFTIFIDVLARTLFPFSNQVEVIAKEIMEEKRNEDATQAIIHFKKLVHRHEILCNRWAYPNAFFEPQLKAALLDKLSIPIVHMVMTRDWRNMSLHALYHLIQCVADDIRRQNEMSSPHSSTIYMAKKSDTSANKKTSIKKPRDPGPKQEASPTQYRLNSPRPVILCKWCKSKEHRSYYCPDKPHCPNCGRAGHQEEDCFKIKRKGRLGDQSIAITRENGHIRISVEDLKNNAELFRSLAEVFNTKAQKQEEVYRRAHEKRKEEREHGQTRRYTHEEGLSDPEEAEEHRTLMARSKLNKCMDVSFGDHKEACLIDTGADHSILSHETFKRLPVKYRTAWKPAEGRSNIIQGISGTVQALGVISLPTTSALGNVEEDFLVIKGNNITLLGIPWLEKVRAVISIPDQSISNDEARIWLKQEAGFTSLAAVMQEAEEKFTLEDIKTNMNPDLSSSQSSNLLNILSLYSAVWKVTKVGNCKILKHRIDTGNATPVRQANRRYSPEQRQEIVRQVQDLLQVGAIEPANSPWSSQIVMIPKKGGEWRMCVDYRLLNKHTVFDAYPLPLISEMLDYLAEAKYFITLDLKAGFHQILVQEEDRPKTAFVTPIGLYQWKVMPFGLVNAPATFQRMVMKLFEEMYGDGLLVYIDDIVIFANSWEILCDRFEKALKLMQEAGIFINVRKCQFGYGSIQYLGMTISQGQIQGDPKKLKIIEALKPPTDIPSLRRFLGMVGYFRSFIPHYSQEAAPLFKLLKKDTEWIWTQEQESSFESLKAKLCEKPIVLDLPHPHWPFVLDTDASGTCIAGVLQQVDDEGRYRVVQYASRTLTETEQKWPIYEQEAFAIVWSILYFTPYLRDRPFTVRTDHQSLKWLWNTTKKRIARWALALQDYSFEILYRKGSKQAHVDIFTRDIDHSKFDDILDEKIGARTNVFGSQDQMEIPKVYSTDWDQPLPSMQEWIQACRECPEASKHPLKTQDEILVTRHQKIYVPKSLRARVMFCYHYGRIGCHQGVQRTYNKLKKIFWWNNMLKDIEAFIGRCLTCLRRRDRTSTITKRGTLLTTDIFGLVAIDIVGPYDYKQHHYHLLTIIDHFSRYPQVVILKDLSSDTVWNAIYAHWISLFGAPHSLLSDNGPQFAAHKFSAKCRSLGIKHVRSSKYYPQGNAVVESFHRFLTKGISSLSALTKWSFEEVIASVLMSYRSSPHPNTGESPYYLVTGEDMILPHFQDWTNYVLEDAQAGARLCSIAELRRDALNRMIMQQSEKMMKRKKRPQVFEIGDLVILELNANDLSHMRKNFGSSKLMPNWSEPCRVIKTFNKDSTLQVKSIWHDKFVRNVPASKVIKIPRSLGTIRDPLVIKEIEADFEDHASIYSRGGDKTSDLSFSTPEESTEVSSLDCTRRAKRRRIPLETFDEDPGTSESQDLEIIIDSSTSSDQADRKKTSAYFCLQPVFKSAGIEVYKSL